MGVGTGTNNALDGQSSLISAVQAGDTDLVRILLHEHSDSGYLDAAFCLAVRMRTGRIAQLLLQHGADLGRSRPDDLIPLSEAVDSGSPALFEALLDHASAATLSNSAIPTVFSCAGAEDLLSGCRVRCWSSGLPLLMSRQ